MTATHGIGTCDRPGFRPARPYRARTIACNGSPRRIVVRSHASPRRPSSSGGRPSSAVALSQNHRPRVILTFRDDCSPRVRRSAEVRTPRARAFRRGIRQGRQADTTSRILLDGESPSQDWFRADIVPARTRPGAGRRRPSQYGQDARRLLTPEEISRKENRRSDGVRLEEAPRSSCLELLRARRIELDQCGVGVWTALRRH